MSSRVDVSALLSALSLGAQRRGREWWARCPNPSHDDGDPSWRIHDDPGSRKHGSHKCWSCGFGGGPWELAAAVLGLSVEDAGEWVRNLGRGAPRRLSLPSVRVETPGPRAGEYRLPAGVYVPSRDGTRWNAGALRYLRSRLVTDEQIERWGIGFAIVGEAAFRVVIPVETGGRLVSHVARSWIGAVPPYLVPPRGRRGASPDEALFGEPALDRELDTAIAVEGVFKALRLELAGAKNVVAVLGASNLGALKLGVLGGFRRVLVGEDPDGAGAKMLAEIRRGLPRSHVESLELEAPPDDCDVTYLRAVLARFGAV